MYAKYKDLLLKKEKKQLLSKALHAANSKCEKLDSRTSATSECAGFLEFSQLIIFEDYSKRIITEGSKDPNCYITSAVLSSFHQNFCFAVEQFSFKTEEIIKQELREAVKVTQFIINKPGIIANSPEIKNLEEVFLPKNLVPRINSIDRCISFLSDTMQDNTLSSGIINSVRDTISVLEEIQTSVAIAVVKHFEPIIKKLFTSVATQIQVVKEELSCEAAWQTFCDYCDEYIIPYFDTLCKLKNIESFRKIARRFVVMICSELYRFYRPPFNADVNIKVINGTAELCEAINQLCSHCFEEDDSSLRFLGKCTKEVQNTQFVHTSSTKQLISGVESFVTSSKLDNEAAVSFYTCKNSIFF